MSDETLTSATGPSGPSRAAAPADLIELARGACGAQWDAADLAAIWRHQLDTPLAQELADSQSPAGTFGELLRDARPSLEALRAVKEYAKRLEAAGSDSSLPREVVWMLYLAAVTAARVRSSERITSTEEPVLQQWTRWGLAQPWLDESTRSLLLQCTPEALERGESAT